MRKTKAVIICERDGNEAEVDALGLPAGWRELASPRLDVEEPVAFCSIGCAKKWMEEAVDLAFTEAPSSIDALDGTAPGDVAHLYCVDSRCFLEPDHNGPHRDLENEALSGPDPNPLVAF